MGWGLVWGGLCLVFPNDGQDFPLHSVCLLLLQGCRVVIKFNCSIKQALQLLCVAGVPKSRLSKLVKLDHYCVETKTHIFVCVRVWEKYSIRELRYPKYRSGYRLYRKTHISVLWSKLQAQTLIPSLFTGWHGEPPECKSSWRSQGSVGLRDGGEKQQLGLPSTPLGQQK